MSWLRGRRTRGAAQRPDTSRLGRSHARSAGLTRAAVPFQPMGLRDRHLLVLPDDVSQDVVTPLVRAWFPDAARSAGGRTRLTDESALTGPHLLTPADAGVANVPSPWSHVWALDAAVERDAPPFEGTTDRDGLHRAFPSGLPLGEEGRGVRMLVALARRLGGGVRVAGSPETLRPDPELLVDLIVYGWHWVPPEVLLPRVRAHLPSAQRAAAPDGHFYSLLGDLPQAAGAVQVQVSAEHPGPRAAMAPPRPDAGPRPPLVTYEVRWSAADPDQAEREVPAPGHVAAREVAGPVVRRIAGVVVEMVAGVVVDDDGLPVDRYAL